MMAFMAMVLLSFDVVTAHAATIYTDKESNNSSEEAQAISANTLTYSQKVSGRNTTYRYVTGTLSDQTDEDWYTLYLTANDETYFTIQGGTGTTYIDILDSNENVIQTFSYDGFSSSENVFRVKAKESMYYYIRLYHTINLTSSYNFTIGNPQYVFDSYPHKFGTQTLPAKGTWDNTINLANISSIPNQAIGYKITVGGCNTSVCSDRLFFNEFYDGWVATRAGYMYDYL